MLPKLVRDKIPDIIASEGKQAEVTIATPTEYRKLLRDKLMEEVAEFLESEDLEELADILEVVLAIASDLGSGVTELERLRTDKVAKRGGFRNRVVLNLLGGPNNA